MGLAIRWSRVLDSLARLFLGFPESATFDILKFSHDSWALQTKLQNFHDSNFSEFAEETEHKENQTKDRNMTRKPRSHVTILYRMGTLVN